MAHVVGAKVNFVSFFGLGGRKAHDAGIVDQKVETVVGRQDLVGGAFDRGERCQVQFEEGDKGGGRGFAHVLHCLVVFGLGACREVEALRVVLGQFDDGGLADAVVAAGHDDHFGREVGDVFGGVVVVLVGNWVEEEVSWHDGDSGVGQQLTGQKWKNEVGLWVLLGACKCAKTDIYQLCKPCDTDTNAQTCRDCWLALYGIYSVYICARVNFIPSEFGRCEGFAGFRPRWSGLPFVRQRR